MASLRQRGNRWCVIYSYIWRWNNCRSTYPEHLKTKTGQQQVKKLADEAMKYFRDVKQGGLWK